MVHLAYRSHVEPVNHLARRASALTLIAGVGDKHAVEAEKLPLDVVPLPAVVSKAGLCR
ncbi:MAG TPA: hypothetical protein VIB38_11505 [Aestuariivirgaceae bacterium]|jgi:hypothetical protein